MLQARSEVMKRLQVPNIIGSLPLQYSVYTDADWMSGPATMACASATRGDTYKLSVCPLVSGTHWGSITFMAAEDYCWYSVEVGQGGQAGSKCREAAGLPTGMLDTLHMCPAVP